MPHRNFTVTSSEQPVPDAERTARLNSPGFGSVFTDHMVTMRWTSEKRCTTVGSVGPRRPFQIDPAAAVFHFGQEIFEGLKAYRTANDGIVLFRPEENAKRLARSAQRLAMPPLPIEFFIEAIEELIRIDHRWVPSAEGASLYLRPFMFATEAFLGVRPSEELTFCVLASPVGAYFSGGQKPISGWVSSDYIRAAKGGTGAAKCGGNYAAGLVAQARATANCYDQTVFLDAVERKWIEELGGMNIFFVTKDGAVTTPPLSGTILEGITRDSILKLATEQWLSVHETPYSYDQWKLDAKSGHLTYALDVRGMNTMFGDDAQLASKMRQRIMTTGFLANVAVAENFDAAVCLAYGRTGVSVVPPGCEANALGHLPLSVLNLEPEHGATFEAWGIHTCAELAALAETDLIAHLGPAGKKPHALARGDWPHLMFPIEPSFEIGLVEKMELECPIEDLERLLFLLSRMTTALLERVRSKARAIASLRVILNLDGGKQHERIVRPALPLQDTPTLLKLLQLDLETHPPNAAILAVELHAHSAAPYRAQHGLFFAASTGGRTTRSLARPSAKAAWGATCRFA
jgi:branched-chain amino acid aminotransferase